MSDELKRFSFADVNFDDQESIAAVYGSGGGLWRREEVTITSAYYHPDIFEKRHVKDATPECGLVLNYHFHSPERQAEIAKRDAAKRHWMTSARYGLGRYFTDRGGVLYKADDTPVDISSPNEEDLRGEYFKIPPGSGAVWNKCSFLEFHHALSQVVPPTELAEEWKKRYASSGASLFVGLRCYLAQVDVDVDATVREAGLKAIKARMEAEGKSDEDIAKARWYPPTRIFVDELIAFEDVDSLAAYDPNAVTVTPEALAYIREKIKAKVTRMDHISRDCMNEDINLHPYVAAALKVELLAPHGINWADGHLSLAG